MSRVALFYRSVNFQLRNATVSYCLAHVVVTPKKLIATLIDKED
jgi:hypothetical protein